MVKRSATRPPALPRPRIRSRRTLVLVGVLVQAAVLAGAWSLTFGNVRSRMVEAVQEYILRENAAFADDLAARFPAVEAEPEFGSPEWERLQALIETAGADLPGGGFACLLDPGGRIICHPDIRRDRSILGVDLGAQIIRAGAGSGDGVALRELGADAGTVSGRVRFFLDGTHYVATRTIPGSSLRLLVHQPESDLLEAAEDVSSTVLASGAVAVALVVLVGGGALLGVIRSYDSTYEELNERLLGALQIARTIQQATFPSAIPRIDGYDVAGWSESADETGGDTYDAVGVRLTDAGAEVVDEGADALVLVVADATGHGIGPALAISEFRAMVRFGARAGAGLESIVPRVNAQLLDDLPPDRFVTAWFGRVEPGSGEVESFSAGQGPLMIRRASGEVETLGADEAPLAVVDGLDASSRRTIALAPGDALVALTDGIFEAPGPAGERFGLDRLRDAVRGADASSAGAVVASIRAALGAFTGEAEADDDRTILVLLRDA